MKTSHLELQTDPLLDGILVEAHGRGTLDGRDYDALLPELDSILSTHKAVNFLLILHEFHGWDIESMARELKWDAQHRDRLRKVAVVGEKGWQKWSVTLSKWFLPGNVRYFSTAQESEARAWVRSSA